MSKPIGASSDSDASQQPFTVDISKAIDFQRCIPNDEKDGTFYWGVEKPDGPPPDERLSFYVKRMNQHKDHLREGTKCKLAGTSIDDSCKIIYQGISPAIAKDNIGRANICLSYGGKLLSGTFRECQFNEDNKNHQTISQQKEWLSSKPIPKALVKNDHVAKEVLRLIGFSQSNYPAGLILLAGTTKSGKSEVARAIALESIRYLIKDRISSEGLLNKKRRLPHLVTFEDPIEKWRIYLNPSDKEGTSLLWDESKAAKYKIPSLDYGFCFTPRQKGVDVLTLADALLDAKRQTPSCFYVGEVRNARDWREILEFAGSGHLVIATTHAGSLTEMIARVLKAVGAITPAARRAACSQLLACLHLELPKIDDTGALLMSPAVWVRTGKTLSALVGDGLSSIIPNDKDILSRSQAFEQFRDLENEQYISAAREHLRRRDIEGLHY
jgi:hypothetical protein